MKLITPFLLIALFAAACTTKTKDARTITENYNKTKSNNPASYHLLKFKESASLHLLQEMGIHLRGLNSLVRLDSDMVVMELREMDKVRNNSSLNYFLPLEKKKLDSVQLKFKNDSLALARYKQKTDSVTKTNSDPLLAKVYWYVGQWKNAQGNTASDTGFIFLNDTLGITTQEEINKKIQ